MIPDDVVAQVQDAADTVAIIGEFVPLKRVGTSWRGPCPFHQGTNKNFSVVPGKGYKCFVCGESGSIFTFFQKRLGLDFVEAVKFVGAKAGVEVREVSRQQQEGPDPRAPYWEMHAAAAQYFQKMLWEDQRAGAAAREYLEKRAITREIADRFGIGFAPREIGALRTYLNSLGYDDAKQLEAGILVKREDESEPRPRFRDRLMFPILDAQGRHVGFGGRLLGPGEPKYLNSSESPVFSKGKMLYGFNWAKHAIRKEERVLLVEGYFDLVRLAAAGVEEVVAPLGTALTEDQAQLLVRATPNVFLLYDSDEAGLKATFRAGLELLRHSATVRVVTLPDGDDPDTFVQHHGADALRSRLHEAVDVFDRQVQLLERKGWFADLHHKRRAIDKLLPTIRIAGDAVMRELYLSRLAEASQVDRGVLQREMESLPMPRRDTTPGRAVSRRGPVAGGGADRAAVPGGDAPPWEDGPPPDDAPPPPMADDYVPSGGRGDRKEWKPKRNRSGSQTPEWRANVAPPRRHARDVPPQERQLLALMVNVRPLVETVIERFDPEWLALPAHRALWDALAESPDATAEEIAAKVDDEAIRVYEELLEAREAVGVPERTLDRTLAFFQLREVNRRIADLQETMQRAADEAKDDLLRQITALQREKRDLAVRVRIS